MILLRPNAFVVCLAWHLAAPLASSVVFASDLRSLIDKIAEAEKLYDSIEVIQERRFRLGKPKHVHSRILVSQDSTIRYVLQGDFVYLNIRRDETTVGGAQTT